MKNVLITGVSKGIGKALAQKYLNEGYFVIGTSLNMEVDFVNENMKVVKLDLSNSDSIVKCVEEIKNLNIKIDILHNNAGIMVDEESTKVIIDSLRKTLEVNLIGTIDFTEKIIPIMNIDGHIVNTTSAAGSLGDMEKRQIAEYLRKEAESGVSRSAINPYFYPTYKISKCAMNMYTLILAGKLKNEGLNIKVSSVHPGWVRTELGGEEAPMLPEEAAKYIFETATDKNIETGQFWFKGEKFEW